MTAAPKYKKYPSEGEKQRKVSPEEEKREVEVLKDALNKLMRDPATLKKAVSIIEDMLNKTKK